MSIDTRTRKPVLANNTGGLSGPAVKPVAVRMVYQTAQAVGIPIIGLGGISTLNDALEFFMAGASAIQMGTTIFSDPGAPCRLLDELPVWMAKHGVARLSDIVGVANPRFHAHIPATVGYTDEVAEG